MAIKITLQDNGPITLDADGEDFPILRNDKGEDFKVDKTVLLCRCGKSKNIPFCDYSHGEEGWDDSR